MAQQNGRRATYHQYQHTTQHARNSKKERKSNKLKRKQSTATIFREREEPNRLVKYSSCHNHHVLSDKHRTGLVKIHSAGKRSQRHNKHTHSQSTFDAKHKTHRRKTIFLEDEESDIDYNENGAYNKVNMEYILNSVRSEYQKQVNHVISKWKELLDRSQIESIKYRNMYHQERNRNKKLQQTVDQLRNKLKKYKNKDNENQVIIFDLQQQLAVICDDLTEITTPSVTPRADKNNDVIYNNYNAKQPLKVSLPVPAMHAYNKSRRRSQTYVCYKQEKDDIRDTIVKIVKSKDDLKKILDGIDDHRPDDDVNGTAYDCLALSDAAVNSNKSISISIKYKDKLFKNKSNNIKVHQSMRLYDFIHHLSDSININPKVIQIQHDTNIIDIRSQEMMNSSLAQMDIDNFDTISVYIDYNKLLILDSDDGDMNEEQNMNDTIKKMKQYMLKHDAKHRLLLNTSLDLVDEHLFQLQYKERLYAIIIDCVLQNDSNLLLELLSTKIAEIVKCQYVRLYFKWNNIVQIIYPQSANITQQIILNLNDDNHDNRSLLIDIMNEYKHKQYTEHTLDSMKCYLNPSQSNSNFNSLFNKQFNYTIDSTLIAPLFFKHQQLVGMIQLINKDNGNDAKFTLHDKQMLAPFTNILGSALKVLYHSLPRNNIFSELHAITRNRVHRGVSRRITQDEIPPKLQINSLSTCADDIRHNMISHNASPISQNVSRTSSNSQSTSFIHAPLFSHNDDGVNSSYTSSTPHMAHNEDKLTDSNAKRKRNESTNYFICNHNARNTMILPVSNQYLVPPPTPTKNV